MLAKKISKPLGIPVKMCYICSINFEKIQDE